MVVVERKKETNTKKKTKELTRRTQREAGTEGTE